MATLENLDTSTVGVIAYWNALNHGLSSVDPTEVLDSTQVETFNVADNGVEGDVTALNTNLTFKYRVKTDGWFIIYTTRTTPNYYDTVYNWRSQNAGAQLPESKHSHIIQELFTQLSNSGDGTFNHTDVSLYHYEFESATNFRFIKEHAGSSTVLDGGIAYTSGTSRFYHFIMAWCRDPGVGGTAAVYFPAGNQIAQPQSSNGTATGTDDVLGNNLMPNSDTFVSHDSDGGGPETAYHFIVEG